MGCAAEKFSTIAMSTTTTPGVKHACLLDDFLGGGSDADHGDSGDAPQHTLQRVAIEPHFTGNHHANVHRATPWPIGRAILAWSPKTPIYDV